MLDSEPILISRYGMESILEKKMLNWAKNLIPKSIWEFLVYHESQIEKLIPGTKPVYNKRRMGIALIR